MSISGIFARYMPSRSNRTMSSTEDVSSKKLNDLICDFRHLMSTIYTTELNAHVDNTEKLEWALLSLIQVVDEIFRHWRGSPDEKGRHIMDVMKGNVQSFESTAMYYLKKTESDIVKIASFRKSSLEPFIEETKDVVDLQNKIELFRSHVDSVSARLKRVKAAEEVFTRASALLAENWAELDRKVNIDSRVHFAAAIMTLCTEALINKESEGPIKYIAGLLERSLKDDDLSSEEHLKSQLAILQETITDFAPVRIRQIPDFNQFKG